MKAVYTFYDLQSAPPGLVNDDGPPIRLGVFGDPVAHSASPPMHNAALQQCGIPATYARLHIRPPELPEALRLLLERGFLGTNLTIPHKAAALGLMDEIEEHARKMGAVNTVAIENGKLVGFNTDGPGIVRAIRSDFAVDLRDLRVLVLGAGGGAGRAIATQCALEKCEGLILANRTFDRARGLAQELAPYYETRPGAELLAIPWEEIPEQLGRIDLIINATPVGMKPTDPSPLPSTHLAAHLLVYDTIYTATRTPLMLAADQAGARSANGLSMLLHQGALSFEIWFKRDAPLEAMRGALLAQMAAPLT